MIIGTLPNPFSPCWQRSDPEPSALGSWCSDVTEWWRERPVRAAEAKLAKARRARRVAEIRAEGEALERSAKPAAAPATRHDEALVLIVQHRQAHGCWPSARQLHQEHGVSIGTASRALKAISG